MKNAVQEIVGRRISGVIVKAGSRSPLSQVFLLFDDGMYYEFYADDCIHGTGGVDRGEYEEVLRYLRGPERDPIFATLSDRAGQQVADREIALGWIRGHLRSKEIKLALLQQSLRQVVDAGFDWRVLYQEARAVRPKEWAEPPAAETLLPE